MKTKQNSTRPRPMVLIILDGWGYRESDDANAIAKAHKPTWEHLLNNYTHTLISGSGTCVGLPDGQMGNSEVGHLNMGAGRIVHQDLTRIDLAIESNEFCQNDVLVKGLEKAHKTGANVHIFGLLSPGGVHSHERHIHAVLDCIAKANINNCYIHPFLDGRDTPPRSALDSIEALEAHCQQIKCGKIVSLIGRYYAMDRDKRWDRVNIAYDLLTQGQAEFHSSSAIQAIADAYDRGETDEFVRATAIHPADEPPVTIADGDVILFMNFRADRARELTQSFIDKEFTGFPRQRVPNLGEFIALSEYDKRFAIPLMFPPESLDNILAEYLSNLDLKQLRIAETEKYAHVTFFFNGGIEKPYPGEDRILIPSPKVATYDLQPEMSAPELTQKLIVAIESNKYDLIVCNFANPDMVGHTGNLAATIKAIETVDTCLGKIIESLTAVGGEALITADHGNAELLYNYAIEQPHTAHTSLPVPLVYFGRSAKIIHKDGKLSDIAPTLLSLMDIPIPKEMSGRNLLLAG